MLMTPSTRLSPIHDELQRHDPRWSALADMPVALDFGDPAAEQALARSLALCDVSALPRMMVKGPNAEQFLRDRQIAIPGEIFGVLPLGSNGLIARTGDSEFFLEDDVSGRVVPRLVLEVDAARPGLFPVLRQDASILLSGTRGVEVFLQTCGYDFREPGPNLVMTRVAGVSASVLSRTIQGVGTFQLWVDGTYGPYLWETLMEIVQELGGGAAGLLAFFPDLARDEA